jgi:hypothetical protein
MVLKELAFAAFRSACHCLLVVRIVPAAEGAGVCCVKQVSLSLFPHRAHAVPAAEGAGVNCIQQVRLLHALPALEELAFAAFSR